MHGVSRSRLLQGNRISSTLLNVVRKHSDDAKAGQNAFTCVRTLYGIVNMTDAALQVAWIA